MSELWACPECGASSTTRNQWHSCGTFDLHALFAHGQPHVRRLFEQFLTLAEGNGPVTVIPQKSRIALQVRMRFAALIPQKAALKGHLALASRHESERFIKVESYSPRNHVHVFRVVSEDEIEEELREWIAMAYEVGCQHHIGLV